MSRSMTPPNHHARLRRARLRLGVGMIVASLVGGAFAFGPAARAAGDDLDFENVEVTQQAYWTRSLGHIPPPALTNQFPPQAVCLVATQLCQEEGGAGALTGPIDQQVRPHQPEDEIPGGDPAGLVMAGGEDTLPTAVIAGARRYISALAFDVPAVPDGHRVDRFVLRLAETTPTYHFDSPAFRQVVLAGLALIRENTDELGKIPEQDPIQNEVHLGVEACPILVDWKAGANQDGKDAPERDEVQRVDTDNDGQVDATLDPQIDCIKGANGVRSDDGVWTFDLTLAANAWAEGDLEMSGVALRAVAPPNLAYGDPDLSTWDQVTFHSAKTGESDAERPAVAIETSEKPKLVSFGSFDRPTTQAATSTGGTETFTEVLGAMEQRAPERQVTAAPAEPAPDVVQAAPAVLSSNPVTAWWVWMLLPLLLGGGWLVTQALTAEPQLIVERAGAMTRLIEARKAARGES